MRFGDLGQVGLFGSVWVIWMRLGEVMRGLLSLGEGR